jgi:2-iminobutanoate/2-iminopropanoate deaminase
VINEMVDYEIIDVGIPVAGPYNLGIKAGNLLFISGQVSTPEARNIKEQTFAAFEKIKKVLQAANASVSNIVKVTVFLKKISDFKEMNQAYREFFEQNGVSEKFPARSTVEAICPLPNGLIEIEAIAVL